ICAGVGFGIGVYAYAFAVRFDIDNSWGIWIERDLHSRSLRALRFGDDQFAGHIRVPIATKDRTKESEFSFFIGIEFDDLCCAFLNFSINAKFADAYA